MSQPKRPSWVESLVEADEPVTATVMLGDGRSLKVTVAEQESGGGSPQQPSGLPKWLRKVLLGLLLLLATAGVTAIVTALVTSHVAKVYADRQQELDIKSSLITTISRSSADTYYDAFDVVNAGVIDHVRGTKAVRRRNRVTAEWGTTSAEIAPILFLHFDESKADTHWQAYQEAMLELAELSYVDKGSHRAGHVKTISKYLETYDSGQDRMPPYPGKKGQTQTSPRSGTGVDPWQVLRCSSQLCSESGRWRAYFRWLGLWLLRQRGQIARDILATDAKNLG